MSVAIQTQKESDCADGGDTGAARRGSGFASVKPSMVCDATDARPDPDPAVEDADDMENKDDKSKDNDDEKVAAFLERNGLHRSAVAAAHEFARARFPGCGVERAPFQGYCSYTLLLRPRPLGGGVGGGGGGGLVQFRPRRHGIDVDVCGEARGVLGAGIVPGVEELGVLAGLEKTVSRGGRGKDHGDRDGERNGESDGELCAYLLERVGGVSLTWFRGVSAGLGADPRASRRRLVADLAVVFADSWRGRREGFGSGDVVVGSGSGSKGRVGESMAWRLEIMESGLPPEFRDIVREVRRDLAEIEDLPWVVTHGDLVPDNVMVHPPRDEDEAWVRRRRRLGWGREERAGGLVGLIDWAEAEWLPFGVGMYGLEEVLGEDVVVVDGNTNVDCVGGGGGSSSSGATAATTTTTTMMTTRFEYYPEAASLRALFWDEVGRVVGDDEVIRRAKRAQFLGVLLWRGIAFDDGALGRVVDEERDWWDLQRLRVWAFEEGGLGLSRGKVEVEVVRGSGEQKKRDRRRLLKRLFAWIRGCC
ncbi:hypothetical protein CORC01_02072 [Colletotrichum orchidophilum]|uniref:Aminoglycoside phosphotransferase domain-containing protein n=1 Tax=Colletotrichum orchidophilum TaxID=1209926 RepID=A0A1G4BN01_9PEZI|nr:uncharacterized protein CORC01_02072 [Colletotrichum orchidophilum]OHF02676.1 hypothetical protein CORC01_02072 [Colletotrichum orchidophilum]